jgi:hypothetical protein
MRLQRKGTLHLSFVQYPLFLICNHMLYSLAATISQLEQLSATRLPPHWTTTPGHFPTIFLYNVSQCLWASKLSKSHCKEPVPTNLDQHWKLKQEHKGKVIELLTCKPSRISSKMLMSHEPKDHLKTDNNTVSKQKSKFSSSISFQDNLYKISFLLLNCSFLYTTLQLLALIDRTAKLKLKFMWSICLIASVML